MSDAEQMWEQAVDAAHQLIANRDLRRKLQPTVDVILSDPYMAALTIARLYKENEELKEKLKHVS